MNKRFFAVRHSGGALMITDAKSFGETIRRRRRELGYTQAFLSEFSGCSVTFILDLENGISTAGGYHWRYE